MPGDEVMAVIEGKENILEYRLMVLHSALKLEARHGMRMSRGPSAYSIVKKEYGFKGNKQRVLDQFEELLREEK
tara:strand:- start:35 stop:256 length:222 start_codon:yes stop_codon:yes gene_type:complete